MKQPTHDVDARIKAFMDKKAEKFPELMEAEVTKPEVELRDYSWKNSWGDFTTLFTKRELT